MSNEYFFKTGPRIWAQAIAHFFNNVDIEQTPVLW